MGARGTSARPNTSFTNDPADVLCSSLQLFSLQSRLFYLVASRDLFREILDYCGHFLLDYTGSLHLLIKPHIKARAVCFGFL